MKRSALLLLLSVLLGFGCNAPDGDSGMVVRAVTLQEIGSCEEVAAEVKRHALRSMNKRLDSNYKAALAGRPCPNLLSPTSPPEGSATEYSTTNNQVAGVDEADFLKNDDQYIYILGSSTFRIVQAWPAPQSHTIGSVAIEGTPRRLFVYGDRALVYSSLSAGAPSECTYGYRCDFIGDGMPTKISVFDIKDRSNPVLVREVVTSSSYVNSRRIDGAVFTVLASARQPFPGVSDWPPELPTNKVGYHGVECWKAFDPAVARRAFDKLRAANTRLIKNTPLENYMPIVTSTVVGAQPTANLLADCQGFYNEDGTSGGAFTTVMGLDISRDDSLSTATVLSNPGAVYASQSALYFSVPQQQVTDQPWFEQYSNVKQVSTVHKFLLDRTTASARYVASGVVKGRVLNQFSMDEYEDHLRIATTSGWLPTPDVHSTLTVLAQTSKGLDIAGVIDNLAPGEDIRSVRFDGKRGYVVTFKKTDPLFVFDLADPSAPKVEAELKIPGFSTYMHRMDENHLLTIGYDAADQGKFAYFTGVMIQIFDVTDAQNPILQWKHVIGTRGSSSEALTNHLAFNYFAPKGLLLLPMTICEGGTTSGWYGTDMTFSGLMVFGATTATGIIEQGRVMHPAGAGVTCWNWWTDANSQVERSIIMDNYVFSISRSTIKVNSIDDLSTDLASVSL